VSIDYKGNQVSFTVAGERQHDFHLPHDASAIPEKIHQAIAAAVKAKDNVTKVSKGKEGWHTDVREANDKLGSAVRDIYDVAASVAKTTQAQAGEQFEYGRRKLDRALVDAQAALQVMMTSAQLWNEATHGPGVGITPKAVGKTETVVHGLSEQLERLMSVPPLDTE
jgi:hypothetical protein